MDFNWVNDAKHVNPEVEVGDTIELISMDDPYEIETGSRGVVTDVNSMQIRVKWKNSTRTLGLIPDEDEYKLVDSIGEDKIPGGVADDMSQNDFDIQQLESGIAVEMEHTSDPELAVEIAMDHLSEDPLYYEKLKSIHLDEITTTASAGQYVGPFTQKGKKKKKNKNSYKNNVTLPISKIYSYRGYFEEQEEELDEMTSAGGGGAGAFVGKLKETFTLTKEDLVKEATSTSNTGDMDDSDSNSWVDTNSDGWYFNDKPAYEGGEIVDKVANIDRANWKDANLDISGKINEDTQLKENENEYPAIVQDKNGKFYLASVEQGEQGVYVREVHPMTKSDSEAEICNLDWENLFTVISEYSINEANPQDYTIVSDPRKSCTVNEMTSAEGGISVGSFEGPAFAARSNSEWGPSKKPMFPGGEIIQHIKSDGVLTKQDVLSEINRVKYHPKGKYMKVKDKCRTFPYCNQGAIDNPITLLNNISDRTANSIHEASRLTGKSVEEITKMVGKKYGVVNESQSDDIKRGVIEQVVSINKLIKDNPETILEMYNEGSKFLYKFHKPMMVNLANGWVKYEYEVLFPGTETFKKETKTRDFNKNKQLQQLIDDLVVINSGIENENYGEATDISDYSNPKRTKKKE